MENVQIFKGSLLTIYTYSPTLISFYLPGLQMCVCVHISESLFLCALKIQMKVERGRLD